MSKLHGDKARFHRIRKQNTARRARIRDLRKKLIEAGMSLAAPNPIVPAPVTS